MFIPHLSLADVGSAAHVSGQYTASIFRIEETMWVRPIRELEHCPRQWPGKTVRSYHTEFSGQHLVAF
jgi:hypothetical protein